MANWSELPKELLEEITTHLKSSTDISRLAVVCPSWHQSLLSLFVSNHRQTFIKKFSIIFNGFTICKRSIFLINPTETPNSELPRNSDPWVIKFEEKIPNVYHLFFPLSHIPISLPASFPKSMDMLNARIKNIGCEYFLCYNDDFCSEDDSFDLIEEKIAFLERSNFDRFNLLSIHISGELTLFDRVVNKWHVISDDDGWGFDDVIVFKDDFYVVDCNGKIVLVNVDYINNDHKLKLVAKHVCAGDQKRLVEIGGELMLVDVYIGFSLFEGFGDEMDVLEDDDALKMVWFKVFKLDKESKDVVEITDLRGYILFLGLYSSFSVSVVDLPSLKGNCIYFTLTENFCRHVYKDDIIKFHCGGVYDLKDGRISYSNLFWAPPPWLVSSSSKEKSS